MKAIQECIATPSSTLGMGNPTMPTDTEVGSGDTFQPLSSYVKKKLKKKKKKINPKDDNKI